MEKRVEVEVKVVVNYRYQLEDYKYTHINVIAKAYLDVNGMILPFSERDEEKFYLDRGDERVSERVKELIDRVMGRLNERINKFKEGRAEIIKTLKDLGVVFEENVYQ